MKSCLNCKFLEEYNSKSGGKIFVCEGEQPELVEDGFYLTAMISPETFDASNCIIYKEKP